MQLVTLLMKGPKCFKRSEGSEQSVSLYFPLCINFQQCPVQIVFFFANLAVGENGHYFI
jgi:hypothetical protein